MIMVVVGAFAVVVIEVGAALVIRQGVLARRVARGVRPALRGRNGIGHAADLRS
jgi:hypothetical protein